MGLQVPYSVDTEIQKESIVWPGAEISWRSNKSTGAAKREHNMGRTPDV